MPLNDYGLFSGTPPKKMGFAEAAGNNVFVPSSTASNKKIGFAEAAGNNVFTPYVNKVTTPMSFSGAAQQGGLLNSSFMSDNMDLSFTETPRDQSAYEKAMADVYANVNINAQGDKGYTGQGAAGGRNPMPSNNNNNYTGGGGGYSGAATQQASTAQPLTPQDLSQRALSGSYYSPDMSAYNDSSLFNYTGPGGVDEYTYGQGLPTDGADYGIWGTPADMVNPYYEGQFAQPPVGVADNAINMSPVVTPDGIPDVSVPAIGGGSGITQASAMPRPGNSAADLNYAQQIEAMGLNSQTAPSTLFDNTGFVSSNTPSLFDRQLEQMGPERIAAMNATLADQERMQQGQISDPIRTTFDTPAGSAPAAGTANPQGGLPVPQYQDNMKQEPLTGFNQLRYPVGTDTADDRFRPAEAPDAQLERRVAAGMNDGLGKLMEQGKFLQDKFDAQEAIQVQDNIFNDHFDRNQAEYTPTLSDVTDDKPMNFADAASTKASVEASKQTIKKAVAQAKVKAETLAKAKAAQVRSKAAAKAKSEAAAKAKAAEARAKAAEARRNPPPKPKPPAPKPKPKPVRTPVKKPPAPPKVTKPVRTPVKPKPRERIGGRYGL